MAAQPAPHFALAPAFANPDVLNYSEQAAAKLFKDKSIVFDWLNILNIPIQGDVALSKDLIESYGEISYEDVKAHALTYMNEDSREAQDSFMLYHCLMNSLTDAAQKQVRTRGNVHPFMFGGKGSGPLLLKVIIMVKLHARGQETQDLLVNLFKGYKACKDAEFVDYIKKKEDLYEEGGEVNYQQLMDWALNKFKTRKESEQWCQRTTEEETIIALQAQVNNLMVHQKKPTYPAGKSNGDGKKDYKQGFNKKGKGKGKPRAGDFPAWMTTSPKVGEKQNKTVEGKDYHWCPNHNRWTRHRPSECKGIGFKVAAPKKDQGNKFADAKHNMKLSNALAAISQDDE
ncbi:hypothetical protein MHU86_17071 [Fragilaria crotonensis]|nr:hypothetical protein MHU86_17071 [Fragilaria crotonensis]